MTNPFGHAAFFAAEIALVATLLLFFYRCRHPLILRVFPGPIKDICLGFMPLHLTLGLFQVFQYVLASTVTLRVGPDWTYNPGSTVLFPASLMVVLLLYIKKDFIEWKRLCVVLVGANLLFATLTCLVRLQIRCLGGETAEVPTLLSAAGTWKITLGSVMLALDIVVLVIVYDWFEWVHLPLGRSVAAFAVRSAVALAAALAVDAAPYAAIAQIGKADWGWMTYVWELRSQVAGKSLAAAGYALALAVYLRRLEADELHSQPSDPRAPDLVRYLFYLRRYRSLKGRINYDDRFPILYNRRFLLEELNRFVPRMAESKRTLAVIAIRAAGIDRWSQSQRQTWSAALEGIPRHHHFASARVCVYRDDDFIVFVPDSYPHEVAHIARSVSEFLGRVEPADRVDLRQVVFGTSVVKFGETGHQTMMRADKLIAAALEQLKSNGRTAEDYYTDHTRSPDPSAAMTAPAVAPPVPDVLVIGRPPDDRMAQAWVAFLHDLSALHEKYAGQWVAYHGPEPLGVGPTAEAAEALCLRAGRSLLDCLVVRIDLSVKAEFQVPRGREAAPRETFQIERPHAASVAAVERDWPRLMAGHPGRWVAYVDGEFFGVGASYAELAERGRDCGHPELDMLILWLAPDAPGKPDGAGTVVPAEGLA